MAGIGTIDSDMYDRPSAVARDGLDADMAHELVIAARDVPPVNLGDDAIAAYLLDG